MQSFYIRLAKFMLNLIYGQTWYCISLSTKMLSHLAKHSYQVTSYISKIARVNLICQYQNIYDRGITDHSTVTVTGLRLVNETEAIMTQSKKREVGRAAGRTLQKPFSEKGLLAHTWPLEAILLTDKRL